MTVGISVAIRCDDCIGFHVKAAIEQGAILEEVAEALAMAIYMGTGPSVMYATHALDAYAWSASQDAKAGRSLRAARRTVQAAESIPLEEACNEDICILATVSGSYAADVEAGKLLAKLHCTACHIVAPDGRNEVADAPPFVVIGRKFDFDYDSIMPALMGRTEK